MSLFTIASITALAFNASLFFGVISKLNYTLIFKQQDAYVATPTTATLIITSSRATTGGSSSTRLLSRASILMLFADRLVSVLVKDILFIEGIKGTILEVYSKELRSFRKL